MKKNIINILMLSTLLPLASCNNSITSDSLSNNEIPNNSDVEVNNDLCVKEIKGAAKPEEKKSVDEQFKEFLPSYQKFASDITYEYIDMYKEDSNIAISPLSIYMALAMANKCANNDTRNQISNALNSTTSELDANIKNLLDYSYREHYMTEYPDFEKKLVTNEEVSNSIWFNDTIDIKDDCVEELANNYYVDSYYADFKNNNVAVSKEIANYIEKKTKGLIKPELEFSQSIAMVILNTLYLKDSWANELDYTDTEYDFKNIDNSITKTKLLTSDYISGRVYKEEQFSHFYTTTLANYKLKFIVPNDNYSIYDVFTKENISKVIEMKDYRSLDKENKTEYYTRVLFPEHETSCSKKINDLLSQRLGITDLFSEGVCDFSSISDTRMFCSAINHISKLKVDKVGIEGAAVTIIEMSTESVPIEIYKKEFETFTIDKAFGFILVDEYDIPVFTGIVTNI